MEGAQHESVEFSLLLNGCPFRFRLIPESILQRKQQIFAALRIFEGLFALQLLHSLNSH